MKQPSKTVPKEKIYLLQISDAYRPPEPLSKETGKSDTRPRKRWSQAFRPMPRTPGGYLPVVEMAKAVAKTGFNGWFSVEIFDGGPDGKGKDKGDLIQEADNIMNLMRTFVETV